MSSVCPKRWIKNFPTLDTTSCPCYWITLSPSSTSSLQWSLEHGPIQLHWGPQWNEETLVYHVNLPSHTTGSVANTLLLHRALGPRCVCRGWYPTCLSVPCNGEESNHLATASSSSSFCLEIELRPRNKATSIIKGVSGERDHSPNSVRTTSSLLKLPYTVPQTDTSWITNI